MPMPPYQVGCYTKGCKAPAIYKVAADWSDGVVGELKTYGLCCEAHLRDWYARARASRRACRLTPGETLAEPGIYHLQRGRRDQTLQRLAELERELAEPVR